MIKLARRAYGETVMCGDPWNKQGRERKEETGEWDRKTRKTVTLSENNNLNNTKGSFNFFFSVFLFFKYNVPYQNGTLNTKTQ